LIKPPIYSSFKEGNDRSQPLKKIDSSEYFPLATLTVTNKAEIKPDQLFYNISQIGLNSRINVSIKGQTIEFVPLNADRTHIGFQDFREVQENDKNKDSVIFPTVLRSYQNLKIKNPTTGIPERSPFYFGYVGAVEGGPKSITKDQLLVLGKKNRDNLDDGETKTYTLYGRLFAVDVFDPIKIISISEDTGYSKILNPKPKKDTESSNPSPDKDFRTSDNTLIFNGTAEPGSKVEVFLDRESIGIVDADDKGNWFYDYSQVKLPDGKYILRAAETNLFGQVKTAIPKLLEIDTHYDIELDFTDPSIANNQKLQEQIKNAAKYWEEIILNDFPNDLPDVNDLKVGFVDDLKIKFRVVDIDGKGGELARTITIPKEDKDPKKPDEYISLRDPLTGQPPSANYLPYHAIIDIDSADFDDITGTTYGLQTLQHEIAHAIGFNSQTFKEKGLIKSIDGSWSDWLLGKKRYGFQGKNALDAYHALGGHTTHSSVPLENDRGLTPSHWHEWLFPDNTEHPSFLTDELMTTSPPRKMNIPSRPDVFIPDAFLSELTLGAFQDLGFNVDPNKGADTKIHQGMWLKDPQSNPVFEPNPLFNIPY